MVEVTVAGMAQDALGQFVLLLRPLNAAPGEGRILPIWIGQQEAASILVAVEGATTPRPLSHDLMVRLVASLGARIDRVEVSRIEDRTFYAEIRLETPAGVRIIDARPSDAVAIARRADAPIHVSDAVLEQAGVPDPGDAEQGEEQLTEEKLAEFRRFLDDVEPEDFEG
ncbi:bifunctional nuclease family protein [Leucobacter sp. wl10]|uniref:bifunctional nuclease family protein n=1 Tax=Leucobacter sp. wl10 TaxID=2304677 RepID=UPI000E5AE41F|nr:bifunctional nuclease family protein [Leucobacter sp. wl10]RGE18565.1 bifunctional nuclease family protein [Leucobacter sp. wl10]